jgi:Mutator-like transposase
MGVSTRMYYTCKNCGVKQKLFFSKTTEVNGKMVSEINTRFCAATNSIGKNSKSITKFTAMMNMPQLVKRDYWKEHVKKLHTAMKTEAVKSMKQAAQEEMEKEGSDEIICCCDGTWHRRGFSSKNGVCTVLSKDGQKVVDLEALTTFCQQCSTKAATLPPDQLQISIRTVVNVIRTMRVQQA